MNIDMEREEQDLCDRLNNGDIDMAQYNSEMRELQNMYMSMAEEAAQDAYDRELDNW